MNWFDRLAWYKRSGLMVVMLGMMILAIWGGLQVLPSRTVFFVSCFLALAGGLLFAGRRIRSLREATFIPSKKARSFAFWLHVILPVFWLFFAWQNQMPERHIIFWFVIAVVWLFVLGYRLYFVLTGNYGLYLADNKIAQYQSDFNVLFTDQIDEIRLTDDRYVIHAGEWSRTFGIMKKDYTEEQWEKVSHQLEQWANTTA